MQHFKAHFTNTSTYDCTKSSIAKKSLEHIAAQGHKPISSNSKLLLESSSHIIHMPNSVLCQKEHFPCPIGKQVLGVQNLHLSQYKVVDVETSQSVLIDQKAATPTNLNKLTKVQAVGLPKSLTLFSKTHTSSSNAPQSQPLETIVNVIVPTKQTLKDLLSKEQNNNFVTLGQLSLSDKPPTISSSSSYDMKSFMMINPFNYSIQSSREKVNLKKITEEESHSKENDKQVKKQIPWPLPCEQEISHQGIQQIFSNIFHKKSSVVTDACCDNSIERKKIAISLITGKENQSARYSFSPSSQKPIIAKISNQTQKRQLQPDDSSHKKKLKEIQGAQSFGQQSCRQFLINQKEDKSIQTSVQNEENIPPEPEKEVPLMHNNEEAYGKKNSSSNKKSILRKSKSQYSNSTTSLFQSSIIDQSSSKKAPEALKIMEELETDKMKLSLFLKPSDQQIIFAGMTKNNGNRLLNKEQLYIDLKDLFNQCSKSKVMEVKPIINQYIRIDNLEQSLLNSNSQKLNNSESVQEILTLSSTFSRQNSFSNLKEELKSAILNVKPNEKWIKQPAMLQKGFGMKKQVTPSKKRSLYESQNKSPKVKSPILQSERNTVSNKNTSCNSKPIKIPIKNRRGMSNKSQCKTNTENQLKRQDLKLDSQQKSGGKSNYGKSGVKVQIKNDQIQLNSVKEFEHSVYDEKQFK